MPLAWPLSSGHELPRTERQFVCKKGWGIAFAALGLLAVLAAVYRNFIEPGFVGESPFVETMFGIVLNPLVWLGFVGVWMIRSEQQMDDSLSVSIEKTPVALKAKLAAAVAPDSPWETLSALSMDNSAEVRLAISLNPLAGREILEDMAAEDPDVDIRQKALKTLEELGSTLPIQQGPNVSASRYTDGESANDPIHQLERLSALLNSGAITQDEYDTLKQKLIGNI